MRLIVCRRRLHRLLLGLWWWWWWWLLLLHIRRLRELLRWRWTVCRRRRNATYRCLRCCASVPLLLLCVVLLPLLLLV